MRRSHNQDAHAALLAADEEQWEKRGHVFLVADGMGAHAVGELASELAASIIPHTYHKYADEGTAAALRKAFLEANSSIYARGQQNREFQGMGTTASALLLREDGAWVGHVGDSRVYRIRGGQIEQLSYDHSLAWELARRKGIRPEGMTGVPTNVIVRSLGPELLVEVDIEGPHPLRPGDVFVLCSDGLSGPLSDYEIGVVASVLPPAEACQFLVAMANLRGGPDNITVVIVRIGGEPPTEAAPAPPVEGLPRWTQRRPWFVVSLVVGLLLAAWAVNLSAFSADPRPEQIRWGILVFILAATCVIMGVGGLVLRYYQEHRPPPKEGKPRLRVYRRTPCQVGRRFLDALVRLETALLSAVRGSNGAADWATHQEHHEAATQALNRNDLSTACQAYCRAIFPLADALDRHHGKAESFQPVWEKTES